MNAGLYGVILVSVIAVGITLFLLFQFSRKRFFLSQREALVTDNGMLEYGMMPQGESLVEQDRELIDNVLEFRDRIVREVMIPRIDIVSVEENTTLASFLQQVLEKGHSRIPVYRGTIDQIVGIAYVKDMLRYWQADVTAITVAAFMRPPYFVPETKKIGDLLQEFQTKKVHIAVAIDEYGGTAGIVTIEDLLEVVFGDIVDEHDAEKDLVLVIDDQTIEVDAKAGIDELEEYMGELIIPHQDFETVGGLLFSILGQVPKPGETVTYQHLKFTILKADKHRIVSVKVERIPDLTSAADVSDP